MELGAIIGSVVVVTALVVNVYLTLWSRRSIDRLAELNFPTARAALRERKGG
jgi:hypothetical protein